MSMRTLSMGARFCAELPVFLKTRIDPDQAREAITRGLAEREANFVGVLRTFVFSNPRSPYRPLFELAGLDETAAVRLVEREGIEDALTVFRRAGVYFSHDEFKSGGEIQRGSACVSLRGLAFDRPTLRNGLPVTTGSGHGRSRRAVAPASRIALDLEHLAATTPHVLLHRLHHGALGLPWAIWRGTLPDPTGFGTLLRAARHGSFANRWFVPVGATQRRTELRNRIANRLIRDVARRAGAPMPQPESVPLDQVERVVDWARSTLNARPASTSAPAESRAPHPGSPVPRAWIGTSMSLAVRVCLAAKLRGLDLDGLLFFGGGEPFTPAKRRSIEAVGARLVPHYFGVDIGQVGLSCGTPSEPNDLHLLEDHVAVIQPGLDRELAHGPADDTFCFTTLRPTAPKILINVEADDCGVLERASCDCALHRLGFGRRIRRVRSVGKLTGGGVTVLRSDLTELLESVLPATFGGGPQDYQLSETEDRAGLPRIELAVHPRIPDLDHDQLLRAFYDALAQGSARADLARGLWTQGDDVRIVRCAPHWTPRAKFESVTVRRAS